MNSRLRESPRAEYLRLIVIAGMCAGVMMLTAGCGRQISQEKEVEVDGSEVSTYEKTVTETPTGKTNVTEKSTTVDPSDGTKESETKSTTSP